MLIFDRMWLKIKMIHATTPFDLHQFFFVFFDSSMGMRTFNLQVESAEKKSFH